MKRVRAGELTNASTSRVFPASDNHRALAAYWGEECGRSLVALRDGTSTNVAEDTLHAYRSGRIAGYHWTRYRKLRKDMF